MSKPVAGTMLSITLNPASEIPLFHQLYRNIRDSILGGRLPPGSRLPSSRTLAADLAISRTTVLTAFDQLTAEGYLEGRVGAGTQVAATLPETLLRSDVRPTPAHLSAINTQVGSWQRRRRWLPPLFSTQPAVPRPFQAQSLDTSDRVVYIGTFSKTLLPALRLGYVILPESLVAVFTQARAIMDRQPGSVEQLALADFIAQGWLERHIRQTRLCYLERQEALVESIRAEMPELLRVSPSGAGMYLTGWLGDGITDAAATRAADAIGVTVIPLSRCFIGPVKRDGLVLGYGPYDTEQIRTAVTSLARALRGITGAGRSRRR